MDEKETMQEEKIKFYLGVEGRKFYEFPTNAIFARTENRNDDKTCDPPRAACVAKTEMICNTYVMTMTLYRETGRDFAVKTEINYRNNKAVKRCENKPNTRCERRLDFHFKRKREKRGRKRVLPLHDGAF